MKDRTLKVTTENEILELVFGLTEGFSGTIMTVILINSHFNL